MKIATFTIRPIQENAYLFYNEKTLDCVIIDPGGGVSRLKKFVEDNDLTVHSIMLTHGHFDHIQGVEELKAIYSVPLIAHREEVYILSNPKFNLSIQMSKRPISLTPDILAADGDVFTFGQDEIKFIHTPGHSPGSCCLYSEKEKVLFTGDTLFCESIGRTDFVACNTESLFSAIENKLFVLPHDVWIYPGHGQPSSIGHERKHNPFFNEEGMRL